MHGEPLRRSLDFAPPQRAAAADARTVDNILFSVDCWLADAGMAYHAVSRRHGGEREDEISILMLVDLIGFRHTNALYRYAEFSSSVVSLGE